MMYILSLFNDTLSSSLVMDLEQVRWLWMVQ